MEPPQEDVPMRSREPCTRNVSARFGVADGRGDPASDPIAATCPDTLHLSGRSARGKLNRQRVCPDERACARELHIDQTFGVQAV